MKTLTQMGSDAKKASTYLAKLGIKERNNALLKVADALVKRSDYIRESNAIDLANGKKNNMSTALLDRLMLTDSRFDGIVEGLRQVADLACLTTQSESNMLAAKQYQMQKSQ